jgi:predicted phosphoribosyltransferase
VGAPFRDRRDAGRQLADALADYAGRADVVVLALPRGGVPVAFEVAAALGAPLGVYLVRKLGVPGHEELAFGALAPGMVRVFNDDVVRVTAMTEAAIERVTAAEQVELARRMRAYGDRADVDVAGRTVILVDDGLATGATMLVALTALRAAGPTAIVVAVPLAPADTLTRVGALADHVVCLASPRPFRAVGLGYDDFSQTSDHEVRALLMQAKPFAP